MTPRLQRAAHRFLRLVLIPLAGLATVLPGVEAAVSQPVTTLKFEEVFVVREQGALHYRAEFLARGAWHRMEAWRDGSGRLKRVTDGQVETFATRRPGDAEFQMIVLDLRRKIETSIDRSNLYRIGNFTDWFDLAHALRHPAGAYTLKQVAEPKAAPRPADACRWYELGQQASSSLICWSARHELPLLIVSPSGEVVWRATELDHRSIPGDVFRVRDEGFVRNNANQDIEQD